MAEGNTCIRNVRRQWLHVNQNVLLMSDGFLFLFVFVYVLPLTLIGGTCTRTAAALRRQATSSALAPPTPYNTAVVVQKRDENRRKVRIISLHLFVTLYPSVIFTARCTRAVGTGPADQAAAGPII